MARTRRQPTPVEAGTTAEEPKKVSYRDPFQQNVGSKIEQLGKGLEGKGKTIMYGAIAVVLIVIVGLIAYSYMRRAGNAGQAALGKAIETTRAQVTASPMPGMTTGRTFATEKEKSDTVIAEFQDVAAKYGSPVSDRAKFFIAAEQLKTDRPTGIAGLQESAKSGDKETSMLAKFALAQAQAADGKMDDAVTLYTELLKETNPLPSKETINFELAGIYEKQGKSAEASDIYFTIVKGAREAKGSDGKPLQMSSTARESSTKLEKLNPEKYAALPPEPAAELPPGIGGM